jgi:hypothetical protein
VTVTTRVTIAAPAPTVPPEGGRATFTSRGGSLTVQCTSGIPYLVAGLNTLFDTREAQAAAALFRHIADVGTDEPDALRARWSALCPGLPAERLDDALAYADAVRDEVLYDARAGAWELLPQRVLLEFLARVGFAGAPRRPSPTSGWCRGSSASSKPSTTTARPTSSTRCWSTSSTTPRANIVSTRSSIRR